jgi:tetratricopeptide (TPR) repeat protein
MARIASDTGGFYQHLRWLPAKPAVLNGLSVVVVAFGVALAAILFATDLHAEPVVLATGLVVGAILIAAVVVLRLYANHLSSWPEANDELYQALLKGDHDRADQAIVKVQELVNVLPTDDFARGVVLAYLALYYDYRAMSPEAKAAYKESMRVLDLHRLYDPISYLQILSNASSFYMTHRDFEAAESMLDRSSDFLAAVRERPDLVDPWLIIEHKLCIHQSLAYLLMQSGELASARDSLERSQNLLRRVHLERRGYYHDSFSLLRAWLHTYEGNPDAAQSEYDRLDRPEEFHGVALHARILMLQGRLEKAEREMRRVFEISARTFELHHPAYFEMRCYQADCLYDLGRRREAFEMFGEVRSLVEDFDLPRNEAWRATLEKWRRRAVEGSDTDLQAALNSDLAKKPDPHNTGIMVLQRIRSYGARDD